jgi:thiol-disulfide isomerase/thioredoxin
MSNIKVFHFWSPECGPCLHMKPVFADLEEEFAAPKYEWFHVNTLADMFTTKQMNVQNIPAVVVMKDGKEVGRHIGTAAARYYALLRDAGRS